MLDFYSKVCHNYIIECNFGPNLKIIFAASCEGCEPRCKITMCQFKNNTTPSFPDDQTLKLRDVKMQLARLI